MRRSALLLPVLLALTGCTGNDDGEAIRSYDISIVASADGSVAVEETIDYDFAGEQRRGILRLLPTRSPYEQTRDRLYPVSDVVVTSPTGAPAETQVSTEDDVTTIRVGDEDTEITGRHTYVLSYRIDAVADTGADQDRLAFNAVGTGWEVPIDAVEARLAGPAGVSVQDAACATGEEGDQAPCPAEVTPRGELIAAAQDLEPGEGMTLDARFAAGTFDLAAPVLADTFSPAQAFRVTPATAGLAVGLLLLLVLPAVVGAGRGREQGGGGMTPAPQLIPPQDALPGQLGTVVDGHAQRHEVSATLLDLAVRGFLRIEELTGADDEGDPPTDWRLVRTTAADRTGLRPYEHALLDALFVGGDTVDLSALQSTFTRTQQQLCASMYRDVVELGWFHADPAAIRRRWYTTGAGTLVAGVLLTIGLAIGTTWALVGLGVVLAGLVLLCLAGRMPRRTAAGARVRRQTEVFRDHLAGRGSAPSPSTADLADSARTDLAVRYLPYAVALGVEQEWEQALRRAGVQSAPDWYTSTHPTGAVWSSVFLFSSSDNPALAPPASTAGSGGTFVGGGAGGGGGGSW